MSITLIFLLIVTILAVLVSLCALVLYFLDSKFVGILRGFGVYFSSILLILATFLSFIPEASERIGIWLSLLIAFVAFIVFFLLVYLSDSYYRRGEYLLPRRRGHRIALFATTLLKNICDGVIVGAAFSLSFAAGIVAITALTAHEIPQKIGDAAVLRRAHYQKPKIAIYLTLISLTLPLVATITWLSIGHSGAGAYIIAAGSGIFVYLAIRALSAVAKLFGNR